MSNPYPPLGTPLSSIAVTLAMHEADSRRARDVNAVLLERELAQTRSELARAAAAVVAWRALVSAMVEEQRECDSGARWTRDLTDPANGSGRTRFARTRADEQLRRAHAAKGAR